MQNDLAALRRALLDIAAAYPGGVSIVSSADLAHTHSAQGRDGFHESAAAFDALVQRWARTPERETLNRLLALQPTAKACGIAGMCMLQTIFDSGHLTCGPTTCAVPSYFGMMVAQWV